MIVEKFGGSSVANFERINAIADKVISTKNSGNDVVVVVSAMEGETNRLLSMAKEVHPKPDPKEVDVLVSTGEQVTIALLSLAIQNKGGHGKIIHWKPDKNRYRQCPWQGARAED